MTDIIESKITLDDDGVRNLVPRDFKGVPLPYEEAERVALFRKALGICSKRIERFIFRALEGSLSPDLACRACYQQGVYDGQQTLRLLLEAKAVKVAEEAKKTKEAQGAGETLEEDNEDG